MSSPQARRRQRSTRLVVAVVLIVVAALLVAGAVLSGSWPSFHVLAAVLGVVLGWPRHPDHPLRAACRPAATPPATAPSRPGLPRAHRRSAPPSTPRSPRPCRRGSTSRSIALAELEVALVRRPEARRRGDPQVQRRGPPRRRWPSARAEPRRPASTRPRSVRPRRTSAWPSSSRRSTCSAPSWPPGRPSRTASAPDAPHRLTLTRPKLSGGSALAAGAAESPIVIPEDNRFESDPDEVLADDAPLPTGGTSGARPRPTGSTSPGSPSCSRAHERARPRLGRRVGRRRPGRGVRARAADARERRAARPDGEIRAWGSVHDRAEGRMLFVHVVDRDAARPRSPTGAPTCCSSGPSSRPARSAGARGLDVQQIDTGAFADDERQHRWLAGGRLRAGAHLVADEPAGHRRPRPRWCPTRSAGSRTAWSFRLVRRAGQRHARRGRPPRAAPGARGRVRRPLQLQRGDLRRVRPPAARGPRPPLGPLVAGRARRR